MNEQALSDRLAGYAEQYREYVAALRESPGERAAQVAKYEQVAKDLLEASARLNHRRAA